MAYQINYSAPLPKKYWQEKNRSRRKLLTVSILLALALTVRLVFPGAGEKLREFLLPGMTDETVSAFQIMVEDVRAGTSFNDAVTAFCREVIANAEIPQN